MVVEEKVATLKVDEYGVASIKFTPDIYLPTYMLKEVVLSKNTTNETDELPGRRLKHLKPQKADISKTSNQKRKLVNDQVWSQFDKSLDELLKNEV